MKDLTSVVMAAEPMASRVEYQRRREAYCLDKVKWSSPEIDALAARYAAAANKLSEAIKSRSFTQLRSAHLDLSEIIDQSAVLNHGIERAIEMASPKETMR